MNKKDDGGPAFPRMGNEVTDAQAGMSLRDYFAGQALKGLIVNPSSLGATVRMSARAYELADAMIAERSR